MLDIESGEVQAAFDDIVTALISRERFNAIKSERFAGDTFDASLSAFPAAFMSGRKIGAKHLRSENDRRY